MIVVDIRIDASAFDHIDDLTEAALDRVGDRILEAAVRTVPVDTGKLRDSLRVEKVSKTEIQVGSDVDYAGFVEVGTATNPAEPYLRPSIAYGTRALQ